MVCLGKHGSVHQHRVWRIRGGVLWGKGSWLLFRGAERDKEVTEPSAENAALKEGGEESLWHGE